MKNMLSNTKHLKTKLVLSSIIILIILGNLYYFTSKNSLILSTGTTEVFIDKESNNYGTFITGTDNNYYLTKDNNVKKIIESYMANNYPLDYMKNDNRRYGYNVVYYYDKDKFILGQKTVSSDDTNINAFVLVNIKTNQKIENSCNIFALKGSYRDANLLISGSYGNAGVTLVKEGVCLYERGEDGYRLLELDSKLSGTETIFKDPSGQNISTTIKNVDTNKRTFEIDVFSTVKKDSSGNNIYVKSLQLSY